MALKVRSRLSPEAKNDGTSLSWGICPIWSASQQDLRDIQEATGNASCLDFAFFPALGSMGSLETAATTRVAAPTTTIAPPSTTAVLVSTDSPSLLARSAESYGDAERRRAQSTDTNAYGEDLTKLALSSLSRFSVENHFPAMMIV